METYIRRLDSVNFSLVALDSKNPGKIQEALAGPKLATAARHPNLNMKLMQWALLEWEAGDKDRSLLILESWPPVNVAGDVIDLKLASRLSQRQVHRNRRISRRR